MFSPYTYLNSSAYFNSQLKKNTFNESFTHLPLQSLPYKSFPNDIPLQTLSNYVTFNYSFISKLFDFE